MNKIAFLVFCSLTFIAHYVNLHADQLNYWDLTPKNVTEGAQGNHLTYSAMVLKNRQNEKNVELLLNIKDSLNAKKSIQVWIKSNDTSGLSKYSLGNQIELSIDPFNTENSILADYSMGLEGTSVETPWLLNEKPWQILNVTPLSDAHLTLNGTNYLIYDGNIVSSNYSTKTEGYGDDYGELIVHRLHIDIKIKGEEIHYIDDRQSSTVLQNSEGRPFDPENFKDDLLKMMRFWHPDDQIKILINQFYPGVWWILNESRNEAIFVAHNIALEADRDLWHRLGE